MRTADPRTRDDGIRCGESRNGDRWDDPPHHEPKSCPYCHGTGCAPALWASIGRRAYVGHLDARAQILEQEDAELAAGENGRFCHPAWVPPRMRCRGFGDGDALKAA